MSLPIEVPVMMIAVPWMIGGLKIAADSYSPSISVLSAVVYDTR